MTAAGFSLALLAVFSSPIVRAWANQPSSIFLNTYAGTPGSMLIVQGHGFGPQELLYASLGAAVVSTTTDADGNFIAPPITVPSMAPGSYPVYARGQASGRTQTASFYESGFYPTGGPSAYYILPGQPLGFFGHSFAPHESIRLVKDGMIVATFTADDAGDLTESNVVTVPFAWGESVQSFQMHGMQSDADVGITMTVGQFYPQISPSTYYLPGSRSFGVSGTGFAPQEPVDFFIAGNKMMMMMMMMTAADGAGNVGFSGIAPPGNGGTFEVRAMGIWSGRASARTITIAQS